MRFSQQEKMEIIRLVENSELGIKRTLINLGINKSTFYNWYARYHEYGYDGLAPKKPSRRHYWNKIPDHEREKVVELALERPELSSRELAWNITDNEEWYISESSVYRILKERGLISPPTHDVIKAADEFKDKTGSINELWQTDFTYFKVVGWGWYYLSTVMDDYSRYIITWELCKNMKSDDVERCIDDALQKANLRKHERPKLLSDNGSCYVSTELAEYLNRAGIYHVRGRVRHPQTQGKIERYHRSMKNVIKLDNYYSPEELEKNLSEFIEYYNNNRYHESLDNLTPADVYFGRDYQILNQRKEIKYRTLRQRRINFMNRKLKISQENNKEIA
jgi:putative transposase